ncbi:VCBS repeat-containing protein [Nocardiopsis rhodophaea]|uniref:VCBS repeat-containing protein n=1 Tax=Nocardiopsis rhodophaea TaxID=280238 RepID=UPI0031E2EE60
MHPHRRLTALTGVGVLLLTACANTPDDRDVGPEDEATRAVPIPEGGGSDARHDVNGDGFPDLLFTSTYNGTGPEDSLPGIGRLVVVYGSEAGPEPTTRTVIDAEDMLAIADVGDGQRLRPGTADLDGDGFDDIPVLDAASASRAGEAAVIWGGPTGPDPDAAPTPVAMPEEDDPGRSWGGSYTAPVPGDFDGDGNADVVAVEEADTGEDLSRLTVLYGPFDRDGAPQRSARLTVDARLGGLVSAEADGTGPTPLLLRHGADGEQPANTLFTTGPADPGEWESVDLPAGGLSVFGDFDGDGATDVAIGDDGTRNDEPGYETESDEVHRQLHVYHGAVGERAPEHSSMTLPGEDGSVPSYPLRTMVAGDLDGDGSDELAVGLDGRGVDVVRDTGTGLEADDASPLVRADPEKGADGRVARAFAFGDYDGDGSDELVLAVDRGTFPAAPVLWWVTDGSADEGSFSSESFTG